MQGRLTVTEGRGYPLVDNEIRNTQVMELMMDNATRTTRVMERKLVGGNVINDGLKNSQTME
jgi:hypothetical protein